MQQQRCSGRSRRLPVCCSRPVSDRTTDSSVLRTAGSCRDLSRSNAAASNPELRIVDSEPLIRAPVPQGWRHGRRERSRRPTRAPRPHASHETAPGQRGGLTCARLAVPQPNGTEKADRRQRRSIDSGRRRIRCGPHQASVGTCSIGQHAGPLEQLRRAPQGGQVAEARSCSSRTTRSVARRLSAWSSKSDALTNSPTVRLCSCKLGMPASGGHARERAAGWLSDPTDSLRARNQHPSSLIRVNGLPAGGFRVEPGRTACAQRQGVSTRPSRCECLRGPATRADRRVLRHAVRSFRVQEHRSSAPTVECRRSASW